MVGKLSEVSSFTIDLTLNSYMLSESESLGLVKTGAVLNEIIPELLSILNNSPSLPPSILYEKTSVEDEVALFLGLTDPVLVPSLYTFTVKAFTINALGSSVILTVITSSVLVLAPSETVTPRE